MSKLLLLGEHLGDGCFGCPVEELQEFSTKLRCCDFENGFASPLSCPRRLSRSNAGGGDGEQLLLMVPEGELLPQRWII